MKDDIKNNTWLSCEYQNGHGKKQIMELLLLVIPFEDTGAMETFLLNAIANDSAYDAEIIRKGNQFVEEVDKERRYLTKRRCYYCFCGGILHGVFFSKRFNRKKQKKQKKRTKKEFVKETQIQMEK